MGFFDNIGKTLSNAGQTIAQKSKDVVDTAKLNSSINDEQKKITAAYEKIGKLYVERHSDCPEPEFVEYFDAIKASEDVIAECQQKLKDLKGVTICPACGKEVDNDAMFCPNCGNRMHTEKPKVQEPTCPNCGAVLTPGSKFCTSCGVAVEEEQVKPQDAEEEQVEPQDTQNVVGVEKAEQEHDTTAV